MALTRKFIYENGKFVGVKWEVEQDKVTRLKNRSKKLNKKEEVAEDQPNVKIS